MTMYQWHEECLLVPEKRERARAWAEERGIDPITVPISGWMYPEDDGVHLVTFVMDEENDSYIQWDDAARRPVMVWQVVEGPLPDAGLLWEASYSTKDDWAQMMIGVPGD